jgi:hypothetical protein
VEVRAVTRRRCVKWAGDSSKGGKFTANKLLATIHLILKKRHLDDLSPDEGSVLLRAVTQDWLKSGRTPLVEWVSAKSRDASEAALTCAANWDGSATFRRSVTGSSMIVAARFWTRTFEDAKKVHWALNGWGEPSTSGRRVAGRRRP